MLQVLKVTKNPDGTYTITAVRNTLYKDVMQGTHILIAGRTGAGKSTVLDGLIYNIVTGGTNRSYELILIDAKRVALSKWKSLPHTLIYASELNEINRAFDKALSICDSRYKRMERNGQAQCTESHIYFIIDEMADLMLGGKEVKQKLQRLIQIGRASNIHLICGTQTFLASVIPTAIKTNFTHILCLKVRNATDSRTILGFSGAESLPSFQYEKGEGDLIYLSPQYNTTVSFPVYTQEQINECIKEFSKVSVWKLFNFFK